MKARDPQVLRWYPSAWRHRYGQELVALLEDTYGDQSLPPRCRLSLMHSGTRERVRVMRKRLNTYTAYSIACAAVWAVILVVVYTEAGDATRHTILLVFGGWAIGWLSATIARAIYPPSAPDKPIDT